MVCRAVGAQALFSSHSMSNNETFRLKYTNRNVNPSLENTVVNDKEPLPWV